MNTISINKYLVMYILIFLLGWASRTRPGYRRQRICNDGHGMGSFSHAFVPLPTILPTGGYQKWPRGEPQRWGPHEWPWSSRGHVRKTELLLSVIKRKRKNNKPTKKENLRRPTYVPPKKQQEHNKKRYAICLQATYDVHLSPCWYHTWRKTTKILSCIRRRLKKKKSNIVL